MSTDTHTTPCANCRGDGSPADHCQQCRPDDPAMAPTDCPTGRHTSLAGCDDDPYCPVDDPACFGNRCGDHDHCGTR